MKTSISVAGALIAALFLSACGTTPKAMNSDETSRLDAQVRSTVTDFKTTDPDMQPVFTKAYAYAVFPDVSAGALIVGGAHGNGEVFRNGVLAGYADVSKGTVGAQIGGQSYAQIVFFENEGAYAQFTGGTMELDAKASAVAAAKGASASANYQRGVMVFTRPQSGLMVQAAVGGQKFRYIPLAGI